MEKAEIRERTAKRKRLLTWGILMVLLCAAGILAACGEKEQKSQVPEAVVKMAEDCITDHVKFLEAQGVAYVPKGERDQERIRVPIEESWIDTLDLLESRDVTEKMQTVEGYESTAAASVEIFDFSYRLKPEKTPELSQAPEAIKTDEKGFMIFDDEVLLALNVDGRYIRLVENLFSKELYSKQWDYIVQRNLGSDLDPEVLKTSPDFTMKVGAQVIGLGMYQMEEELPLKVKSGEGVPDMYGPGIGGWAISWEDGSFQARTVDYYEFNQAKAYTAYTYLLDYGGHGTSSKGIKAGDGEDAFMQAYEGGAMIRYDNFPDEGLAWKKNDYVYAQILYGAQRMAKAELFYVRAGVISAIELLSVMDREQADPAYPLFGGEGYYAVLEKSQQDCNAVTEGFRKYEAYDSGNGRGIYDVSLPRMKPGLPGAEAIDQAIKADWGDLMAAPEKDYKDLAQGFSQPVTKVFYRECKFGDIYEICVFSRNYSGSGSGILSGVVRYAYDSGQGRALTDEEFLAAMHYDKEYVVNRCYVDCIEKEDWEEFKLDYRDIKKLYYIDEQGNIKFVANFYS